MNVKSVAAIATVYTRMSHADTIIGKILEGPFYDGKDLYQMKLVSLYVDQKPKGEMSAVLSKKYGFRQAKSIDDALTFGTEQLKVEGVVIVAEHGDYPKNSIGQVLYPRRKFFEQVCDTFQKTKKVVPVFNDKHLSATWKDSQWIYDKSLALMVPLMAGSSLPFTWRKPELNLPIDCEITEAVVTVYGDAEAYGFHALEGMQCLVERRKGGETGIESVRCLRGEEMWKAGDRGEFSLKLLEEAITRIPVTARGNYREITAKDPNAGIWLIQYRDGLKGVVAMLNSFVSDSDGGAFCFATKLKDKTVSCQFYLQDSDPFAHFAHQLKGIEALVTTQHPPFPLERTLLTSGLIDAIMNCLSQGGKKFETPHLKISYKPVNVPHAQGPITRLIKRS